MPFAQMVSEASGGASSVSLTGPEAVPPFEQLQPVAAGVFDILFTSGAYHSNEIAAGMVMDAVPGRSRPAPQLGRMGRGRCGLPGSGPEADRPADPAHRLQHLPARPDRRRLRPGRAQDPRQCNLYLADPVAGGPAGGPAPRRDLFGPGKGRRGRCRLAGDRRAGLRLVRGGGLFPAPHLRHGDLHDPDEPRHLDRPGRGRADDAAGTGRSTRGQLDRHPGRGRPDRADRA